VTHRGADLWSVIASLAYNAPAVPAAATGMKLRASPKRLEALTSPFRFHRDTVEEGGLDGRERWLVLIATRRYRRQGFEFQTRRIEADELHQPSLEPADRVSLIVAISHRLGQLVVADGVQHSQDRRLIGLDIQTLRAKFADWRIWRAFYLCLQKDETPCEIGVIPRVDTAADYQIDGGDQSHRRTRRNAEKGRLR
jgi:hypothetical protein